MDLNMMAIFDGIVYERCAGKWGGDRKIGKPRSGYNKSLRTLYDKCDNDTYTFRTIWGGPLGDTIEVTNSCGAQIVLLRRSKGNYMP